MKSWPLILGVIVSAANAAAALPAWAQTYNVDPVHSSLLFRSTHLNTGHVWGRFNEFSGTIAVDEKNPAKSSLAISVKTASVDTAQPKRDEHLRNPDFFNAVQFPTIEFKSDRVKAIDKDTLDVSGTLTLHGESHPLTIKVQRIGSVAKSPFGDSRAGFETTFQIKRSDFGMKNMLEAIGDEVLLIASFEGAVK